MSRILRRTTTMTKILYVTLSLCFALCACTETTGTLGVIENGEELSTRTATFDATTETDSLELTQLPYNGRFGYLGAITDPETGGLVQASFATQFVTQPDFMLPPESEMIKDADGVVCDSMELMLFVDEAYGDLNNVMKVEVYYMQKDQTKLNTLKGINFDEETVADLTEKIGGRVFSFLDHNYSDNELNSASHAHTIRIPINTSIGQRMLNQYYEHPEWYSDNGSFREHVFPGVYCRVKDSEGTMINVAVSALDVNFTYVENGKEIPGYIRFGGTSEVFQCTRISEPKSRKHLCEVEDTTYLKNPDGVITTITVPVDEIRDGHEGDSISMCTLTLQAYSKDDNAFDAPPQLLLVPKCLRYKFFTERWNTDDRYFYVTSFSSQYNAYVFTNISRLITGLKLLKAQGVYWEEDWKEGWKEEDWYKVDVIPVSTTSNTFTYTTINYDITPSSVCLVPGTESNPVKIQVVYSYFKR